MSGPERVTGGGLELDVTRMRLPADLVRRYARLLGKARTHMARLEAGDRVNTHEKRRVGHYWLRDPKKGPPDAARSIRLS